MHFYVFNQQAERREGLKALLKQLDRHARFNEGHEWEHAERTLRRAPSDLLVVDWEAQSMTTADLARMLTSLPSVPAAALVDDGTRTPVMALLEAGILGVIPRDMAPRLIVRALELVLLGGHYVPACALDPRFGSDNRPHVARPLGVATSPTPHRARAAPPLSPRQREILRLVHLGNTNKVIARTLGISEGTVKIHLASVFKMLGATNRAAAVALYNGWQFDTLRVLHRERDWSEPVAQPGARGPLPLRHAHLRVAANDDTYAAPALRVAQSGMTFSEGAADSAKPANQEDPET